jgi:hypothetical protein
LRSFKNAKFWNGSYIVTTKCCKKTSASNLRFAHAEMRRKHAT